MKLFLKHIGEFLTKFPIVSISRNDDLIIKKAITQHLGVSDFGKVRDLFEGQEFYDRVLMKVGAIITCNKYLGIDVNIKDIKIADLKPKITIKNLSFDIVVFEFGELPVVDKSNIENNCIFVLKKNEIDFQICGYANKKVVIDNLVEVNKVDNFGQVNECFTGFNQLQNIRELTNIETV